MYDLHSCGLLILQVYTPGPTDLSRLDQFSQLETVAFINGFTDEQLQRLPECDCVAQVDVHGSYECTDLGLAELERAFPNLKELTLDRTGVTPAAVTALQVRRPGLKVTLTVAVEEPDDEMEEEEEGPTEPVPAPVIEEGAGGDRII